jgi:hypothetical protein
MSGRFVPPATAVPRPRLNAAAVVNKTKRKNTEKAVRKAVEEAEKIANTLPSASHQLPRPTLDGNAPAAFEQPHSRGYCITNCNRCDIMTN